MEKPIEATKPRSRSHVAWAAIAAITALLAAGGVCVKVRGLPGAASGSESAAVLVPELPSDAARWVNGAPVLFGASRGQVVLVDGWHPT